MIQKKEFYYDSRDNIHKIYAVKWIPDNEIKCVVQIIHGKAEHIERYDDFARYLAQNGFLVIGNDHLGHGKSVKNKEEYGYFCEKDAVTVLVRDVHRLKKIVQQENPGIPFYILGHSMGSFILRNYLFRYGKGIDGAIICGTASFTKAKILSGKALLHFIGIFKGMNFHSKFFDKIVDSSNNARIVNARTPFDWLCTDEEIVNQYSNDDACGFVFTINGFLTLLQSVDNLNKKKYLALMPKSLPILFVAGTDDPIGNYTEGVKQAYRQFEKTGMTNLSLKFYDGFRHEILNEKDKLTVYQDIYDFINCLNEKQK